MNNLANTKKSNYTVLYLLLLLFFVPLIAAWVFYKTPQQWYKSSVNNGVLLKTPLHLEQFKLNYSDGKSFNANDERGHWLMLYRVALPCDKGCETNLYYMRQVRTALGKDRERVQRMVITDATPSPALDQLLIKDYQGTQHLINSDKLALQTGSLYLVDPIGNIIMQYSGTIEPKKLLTDINRLLKISKIG